MAAYAWRGIENASGKNVKGVRDAESPKALRTALRREGILVTKLDEASSKKGSRDIDLRRIIRRKPAAEVAVVTRQLATLLKAGIPLVESLNAILEQIEHPDLQAAFTQTRDRVNEGISFAEALRSHPKIFSGLFVNMVAAGEASGTLEAVLARLADFLENQARLRGKVSGALAYPAFMAVLATAMIFVLMGTVVPQVSEIFENFGQALPWYTRLLMTVSNLVTSWWWLIFGVLGLGIYSFKRWLNTKEGRHKWDLFLLRAPLFNSLVVLVAVSRFAHTLATLLASGVPVLRAMEITRNVLGNTELMRVVEEARSSVREGESIAKPLKQSGRFPPMVTHMIAVGERSGQLEEMLENVANAYDQQVETRLTALTSILGPLMIVMMGGILGGISFAIMMPLFQINEMVE